MTVACQPRRRSMVVQLQYGQTRGEVDECAESNARRRARERVDSSAAVRHGL